MHIQLWVTVAIASYLVGNAVAVRCVNCYANGALCVNAPSCEGNYCLFEEIRSFTGKVSTRKTCYPSPFYRFDDGTITESINDCIVRRTSVGFYNVKICNDYADCNSVCPVPPRPTLPYIGPGPVITSTYSPFEHLVTCYECTAIDGRDCRDRTCRGRYCSIVKRLTATTTIVEKSCLQRAEVILDDGTVVQEQNVCQILDTRTTEYIMKICNDKDFCNDQCDPGKNKQRQPLLTCYDCQSTTGDCNYGSCQGYYCIFKRERNLYTNDDVVTKGCSATAFVEFDDGTPYYEVNACEYRNVGDNEYELKVCTTSNCNRDLCPGNPNRNLIQCPLCAASGAKDCQPSTSCMGQFCLFERQTNLTSGLSIVRKNCTSTEDYKYLDNSYYNSHGSCQYKVFNDIGYSVKVCNSSYCTNQSCADVILTTTTHLPFISTTITSSKAATLYNFAMIFMIILFL